MKKFLLLFNFSLFPVVFLVGCAYQSDLNLLRRELITLRETTSKEEREMDNRTKEIENRLKELDNELKRKQADLEADQKNILLELQSVRGLIEESVVKSKKIPSDFDEFKKKLNLSIESLGDRLAELEKRVYSTAGESPAKGATTIPLLPQNNQADITDQEPKVPSEFKSSEEENKASEEEMYKEAYQEYLHGEFEKARQKFRKYLELYPNSKNAGNAQYWIGECYYSQKKYEEAIVEFFEVIKKYPKGSKAPAAYLKLGMAFLERGDKENAKNSFVKIINEYKNSDEAKIAVRKIEEIK